MGGGGYTRDVGRTSSTTGFRSRGTSTTAAKKAMNRTSAHDDVSPKNRHVKSTKKSPIVVLFDVTGSNIEFATIVRDKSPMMYGQIKYPGLTNEQIKKVEAGNRTAPVPYLTDFDICFAACGDATVDKYPLQVPDPSTGNAIDKWLSKLCLEGEGGTGICETYELAAYYFANYFEMRNAETPVMIIIADEMPYDYVDASHIKRVLGGQAGKDIDSKTVFADLFRKFKGNVYILLQPYRHDPNCGASKEILRVWRKLIPAEYHSHIIPIIQEKSIVDLMLYAIAHAAGYFENIDGYEDDLRGKGQSNDRITAVRQSFAGLSSKRVVGKASGSVSNVSVGTTRTKKKTKL